MKYDSSLLDSVPADIFDSGEDSEIVRKAIELPSDPKQLEEAAKRTHESVSVRQFIDAPFFPNKKADCACPLCSDAYAAARAGLAFLGAISYKGEERKAIYLMPLFTLHPDQFCGIILIYQPRKFSVDSLQSDTSTSLKVDLEFMLGQPTLSSEETSVGAAKKSKKADVIPPDPIGQASHKIENLDSEQARKMAADLLDGSEFSNFQLGGVLLQVMEKKFYTQYGFADFKSFVAEFGFKYRTALYLAQIYNQVLTFKLDWNSIKHIGWTKLKTLLNPNLNLITSENVGQWIKKAEGMTVKQLEGAVKGASSGAQNATEHDPGKNVTTMTFKLHGDQKDLIRAALEKAKKVGDTQTDTVALEYIATQFLATPSVEPAAQPAFVQVDGQSMPEVFKQAGYMAVLEAFGAAFPDIELSVNIPNQG